MMDARTAMRMAAQDYGPMSSTIERDLPLSVTLTAEQWQTVMQVLSNGPYSAVAPLIGSIQQQCMRRLTPMSERANGEDQDARL
jgi:hypothetical protein